MDTPPQVSPTPQPPIATSEDKTVAILSYITPIGFIAAIIIHSNKKTALGAYHLRQTLGLFLTGIAVVFCEFILIFIPFLGWLCIFALWVALFVLWLMGLLAAVNGQMKPVPILGPIYQKTFSNTFN